MLKQLTTVHKGQEQALQALREGQNVLMLCSDDRALAYYQREILRGLRDEGAGGVVDMNTFGLSESGAKITFTTLGACTAAMHADDKGLVVWLCLPWQFGNLLAAEGVLGLAAPTSRVYYYTESAL
jgi:hypothetical protein